MRRWVYVGIAIAVLLAVGGLAISKVFAQQAPPPGQGAPRMPMMPMMPMMGGGGTAMVASGNYVYVLWMGSIYVYQFDSKEKKLTQVTSAELPRPQMPTFGPGPGMPGGPAGGPQFAPQGGAQLPPAPPFGE
ncbi:hypothetical protein H5T87_07375 [bacterium]|nr:hypothetical protein [bacterium]